MKARIIIAETAAAHPDGTVSLIRAGITVLWSASLPVQHQSAIWMRIESVAKEVGEHKFELRCTTEAGKDVLNPLQGSFQAPKDGGGTNLILFFGASFEEYGVCTFALLVDDAQLDSQRFRVCETKPEEVGHALETD